MRKIIAALQVSLDGFIEGPNEELDWVDSWRTFDIIWRIQSGSVGSICRPSSPEPFAVVTFLPIVPSSL